MNAQTLPDILKTFRVLSVSRECSVVTHSVYDIVTVSVTAGRVDAWVNGIRTEPRTAQSYVEHAEQMTMLEEVRPVPLAPDALGTQGAWELRRALRLTGMTGAEAVAYAGAVVGRELACIAADTLTAAEAGAIIAQARTHLGNRAHVYANTLQGFSNGAA